MLTVHTARISSRDPDRVDITRKGGSPFGPSWALLTAGRSGHITWPEYCSCYLDEMRASYRHHRTAWDELLQRERAVLVCYCVDPEHCHRTILARDILAKIGAVYEGELS